MNKILLALLFILPASVIAYPAMNGNLGGYVNIGNSVNASVNSSAGVEAPGFMMNGSIKASVVSNLMRNRLSTLVRDKLNKSIAILERIQAKLQVEGIQVPGFNTSISAIMEDEINLNSSIENNNFSETATMMNNMYSHFNEIRNSVQVAVDNYRKSKINQTIQVAGGLMNNIQNIINQLQSQGKNVTTLQSEFDQIKIELSGASNASIGGNVSDAAHFMSTLRNMLVQFRGDLIETVNGRAVNHEVMKADVTWKGSLTRA